ncbi:hypothetical protein N431DRAFT_431291 [Stipitochalara longipes BDJ]|nr:hypothetical protein N431DRAFT_431291 [Stipitochalara longipes BDJ]
MDDPWGSPWADETQTPHPVKLKEEDFAVKPTTPVKAASLALEQKTNSPWDDADDDGFGDWTVGTPEKGNGLELDGADDGWQSNVGHRLGYGLTVDGSHALSGSWNNVSTVSADGIPKLAPSPLPKPSDILRQPSPDPWAVDTDREDKHVLAATVPEDQHGEGSADDGSILDSISEKEIATDAAPMVVGNKGLPGAFGTGSGIPTETETNGIDEESSELNAESVEILEPFAIVEQNGNIPEAEHISSRPSSSPSDQSHHDEITQDSPRTSLDEELKRPPVARKVSTKIQELVEHFDGLAKQEDVATAVVGRSGSPGQKIESVRDVDEAGEEEEMDDFGDFEDVQSDTEEPMDEGKAGDPDKSPVVEDFKTNLQEPVATREEPQTRSHPKDLGPVEFTVNATALDQLYSGVAMKPPSENIFIPDVVPHDSFSSTEERKTWYRISRYGTMRKYNTGADENYIRVNWTQSQVRTETLKIVARWIEEDRISGRVVLGGASKGSSIFGWNDSKAAPVSLATAFAVKDGKQKVVPAASEPAVDIPREWPKGLVRNRSTSGSPKSRRKSSTKSITSEDPKSQLPVANFGWSAAPPSVQDSESQTMVHKKQLSGSGSGTPTPIKIAPAPSSVPNGISSPLAEPTKRAIPINGLPPRPHSIAHTSISVPPPLSISNIAKDDDDWGELVSSPSTNTPQVPPAPSGSLHRTTGSLSSVFPSTARIPQMPSNYTQPPEQNFGWVNGSNEILSPMTTNSMTTNTQDTFSQNSFTALNNDHIDDIFGTAAQTAHQPAASVDPWASADFSFFETSAAPASKPKTPSIPKLMPKSVTFSTPPVTSMFPQSQKSREEIEQDRIVQSVVEGLPDLSYMLRK